MNPDGFALRWRGNANNIDLNRDFPDQVSTPLHRISFPYGSFYCPLCPLFIFFLVAIQLTVTDIDSSSLLTTISTPDNLKLELL
jgi:hypothetical protein